MAFRRRSKVTAEYVEDSAASSGLQHDAKKFDIEHVEEMSVESAEALAAEEKALVRKIDLALLPTIFLMYLLSYMDRTKYAFPFHLVELSKF